MNFWIALWSVLCAIIAIGEARFSVNFDIVERSEWGARNPARPIPTFFEIPTSVVIFESQTRNCYSKVDCMQTIKEIQEYEMDVHRLDDIQFNFLIGEDGNVYNGTGWNAVGPHTAGNVEPSKYNGNSLEICVIGNFHDRGPNREIMTTVEQLLSYGVMTNKLRLNYKLYAYGGNVRQNELSRGLKNSLMTWRNFRVSPYVIPRCSWNAENTNIIFDRTEMPSRIVINYLAISNVTVNNIKQLQDHDIEVNHWVDVSCNFLIHENGLIYEGRGWDFIAQHSNDYNRKIMEICIIGNFDDDKSSAVALGKLQDLLDYGVAFGLVNSTYVLYGLRHETSNFKRANDLYTSIKKMPFSQDHPYLVGKFAWSVKKSSYLGETFAKIPNMITVYIFETSNATTMIDSIAKLRTIEDLHVNEYGWKDVGYNFFIDDEGNVYEGRGWNVVGQNSKGRDLKSLEICIMTNIDGSNKLNNKVLGAVDSLLNYGMTMEKIHPMSIMYLSHHATYNLSETDKKLTDLFDYWAGYFE